MSFKPQLYPNSQVDPEDMRYPLIASYKLDGVRAILHDGEIYSRSWKPIPNIQLRDKFKDILQFTRIHPNLYLDGEIYSHELEFNEISGLCRRLDDEVPESLTFWMFDVFDEEAPNKGYLDRQETVNYVVTKYKLQAPFRVTVRYPSDVKLFMQASLEDGYEGLILNATTARYKQGRITLASQDGYKLKPYETFDGVITGVVQATVVDPSAEKLINELGYSETSKKKDDRLLVPKAAAFEVEWEGQKVRPTLAMTEEEKVGVWLNREEYIGKWCEFKGMLVGAKDLPRHPIFLRMRPDKDGEMSELAKKTVEKFMEKNKELMDELSKR
jgi:DNA ligase-1